MGPTGPSFYTGVHETMKDKIRIEVEVAEYSTYIVTVEDELCDHDNYENAIRFVELNKNSLKPDSQHTEYDAWDRED